MRSFQGHRTRSPSPRHLITGNRLRKHGVFVALLVCGANGFHQQCHQLRYKCSPVFVSSRIPKGRRLGHVMISSKTSLANDIKLAFKTEETDGVLKLAAALEKEFPDVDEIVEATMAAAEGKSGDAASILNAWIGSCYLSDDLRSSVDRVKGLIEAFEDLEETQHIFPNLVTFSLAFAALQRDEGAAEWAEYVMDEARRRSKKAAGAKRRKALAKSRRRISSTGKEAEQDLKHLLGDDFAVLQETDDFLVVNKPSGVPCSHKRTTTAGKVKKGKSATSSSRIDISLEDALLASNVPLSTLNPESLGLVHRLDRGSSGCLVLAKSDKMHSLLLAEFFVRRSEKSYSTIVSPCPGDSIPTEGEIDLPVDGHTALSKYKIRERYGSRAALLDFDIYTGRKHQIRVHAAQSLQSPVLFDDLYGSTDSPIVPVPPVKDGLQKFMLHAASLRIPAYGVQALAPLPSWWKDILDSL